MHNGSKANVPKTKNRSPIDMRYRTISVSSDGTSSRAYAMLTRRVYKHRKEVSQVLQSWGSSQYAALKVVIAIPKSLGFATSLQQPRADIRFVGRVMIQHLVWCIGERNLWCWILGGVCSCLHTCLNMVFGSMSIGWESRIKCMESDTDWDHIRRESSFKTFAYVSVHQQYLLPLL